MAHDKGLSRGGRGETPDSSLRGSAFARVLEADSRIAYGVAFGSTARGQAHADSDLDVAIGLAAGAEFDALTVDRRVRAVLDYLDYRPFESAFVQGVLHARG